MHIFFQNVTETTEMKLVNNAFDFARSIAEVKMNDTELALYSAYVLLSPGNMIFVRDCYESCLVFKYYIQSKSF